MVTRPLAASLVLLVTLGCSNPQPGPDKSALGTLGGSGWGAGAGAIVGNQIGATPEGIAVGAALGAVDGLLTGGAADLSEDALIEQERQLAQLRTRNFATARAIRDLSARLDTPDQTLDTRAFQPIYFDTDVTTLSAGAIDAVQRIADEFKRSGARKLVVSGHSDDGGTPEYNLRMSEARARAVGAALGAAGVSLDQVFLESLGSTRPVTTNGTPEGRQLNRRVEITIRR